jgi:hypothetical protein
MNNNCITLFNTTHFNSLDLFFLFFFLLFFFFYCGAGGFPHREHYSL